MGKEPKTGSDMRSTVFDYQWGEVGAERGGPIKRIKEKLLFVCQAWRVKEFRI